MEETIDYKSIAEQYKTACLSSINFGQNVISNNFNGKEHLAKAYQDIELAFKAEIKNEKVFLEYLVDVYAKKSQLKAIDIKIGELDEKKQMIGSLLEKIKAFRVETCANYINSINKKIDEYLSNSCVENLELYRLLTNPKAKNFVEVKKRVVDEGNFYMVSELENLMIKSSPKKDEIQNLLFLRDQVLFYKRQAGFKNDALRYQLEKIREAKSHLHNMKNAIINQLNMIKIDLNAFGDYELRDICVAISETDRSFMNDFDINKANRGSYIYYISTWLKSFGDDLKKERR